MQKFDMGRAWTHCVALVRHDGWKVAGFTLIVYGAVILLGMVGVFLFAGVSAMDFGLETMERLAGAGFAIVFFAVVIFSILLFTSYFAAWRLTLSNGQDNFAGSLLYGLMAAVPAMLATLLVFAVLGLAMALMTLPFGLGAGLGSDMAGAAGIAVALSLLTIPYLVLVLFLVARLGLCGPIMAVHKSYNPFFGFRRSWKATRGNTGMLMLYVFLVNLIFGFVYLFVTLLTGGMDAFVPGLSVILSFPVNIALGVVYTLIPAGMYLALIGDTGWARQDVEAIFE